VMKAQLEEYIAESGTSDVFRACRASVSRLNPRQCKIYSGVLSKHTEDDLLGLGALSEAVEELRSLAGVGPALQARGEGAFPYGLVELMHDAAAAQPRLLLLTEALAENTQGKVFRTSDGHRAKPKGPFRALEKVAFRREGCWSSRALMDLSRDGIEYATLGGIAAGLRFLAAAHLRGELTIVRVKNRVAEPNASGWADVMVNVGLPLACGAEHVAEIQFSLTSMMVARNSLGGHVDYNEIRSAFDLLEYHGQVGTNFSRSGTRLE